MTSNCLIPNRITKINVQNILFCASITHRQQVGLPSLYGIQVQDMEYYLSFALVIIFFQLCVDVFIHGVLELFHGWKIYDYLVSQLL